MITVRIPTDKNFNFKECKKLFNNYKKFINDKNKFRNIVDNTFFYSFFYNEKHIGCTYFYMRDNKLFVNGFANRHLHTLVIDCLKQSLKWFNCNIYAETEQKTAKLCLLRAGFKKISNKTLFISFVI